MGGLNTMSLWEKDQDANRSTTPTTSQQWSAPSPSRSEMTHPGKPATIGQSVQIKGELSGQEDLIIDGSIDGKILVHGHHLTIGPNGHINAEVHAKSVQINGAVTGNITADDRVEISSSGSVLGDIMAPRVAWPQASCRHGFAPDVGSCPGHEIRSILPGQRRRRAVRSRKVLASRCRSAKAVPRNQIGQSCQGKDRDVLCARGKYSLRDVDPQKQFRGIKWLTYVVIGGRSQLTSSLENPGGFTARRTLALALER
jgi:cytoskeletal protein CcmA (bactofilin family)